MIKVSRVILHADCNAFYVSCELCYRPELKGKAVIVGGDAEARHGIVLAKSDLAKAAGIKTGHVLWQAKQLCPDLIILKPNYKLYLRFSRMTRKIFGDYTDHVEPFGLDEAWLDLSGETLRGGKLLADDLRARIANELGITASVGVADNKIMAKLGSDMRKPDATTLVAPEDYPTKVWPLPVGELLYVGRSTVNKLTQVGIQTIGDLARLEQQVARSMLGKNGEMLWVFANGLDMTPVSTTGYQPEIKSIGNSTTTPRDLVCDEDVLLTMWVLAESVAARLRENGLRARTVQIHVRNSELDTYERQTKLNRPTQLAQEIVDAGMGLFRASYNWAQNKPIRSIGVRGADLETVCGAIQLSVFEEDKKRLKLEDQEKAIDGIRARFGHFAMQRGSLLADRIGSINPKDDHTIHPVSFLR